MTAERLALVKRYANAMSAANVTTTMLRKRLTETPHREGRAE